MKDGWKASFGYRPDYVDLYSTYPVPSNPPNNAGKEIWELYDLNTDFNERVNLAKQNPQKLKELQALFEEEAKANHAYPLINWTDTNIKARELHARGGSIPAIPWRIAQCTSRRRRTASTRLRIDTNGGRCRASRRNLHAWRPT